MALDEEGRVIGRDQEERKVQEEGTREGRWKEALIEAKLAVIEA